MELLVFLPLQVPCKYKIIPKQNIYFKKKALQLAIVDYSAAMCFSLTLISEFDVQLSVLFLILLPSSVWLPGYSLTSFDFNK